MTTLSRYADTAPHLPLGGSDDLEAIQAALAPAGVRLERWTADTPLADDATDADILAAYADDINRLQRTGGYQSCDVIRLFTTPDGWVARFTGDPITGPSCCTSPRRDAPRHHHRHRGHDVEPAAVGRADAFVSDVEGCEEIARIVLAALDMMPAGKSDAQAADRLAAACCAPARMPNGAPAESARRWSGRRPRSPPINIPANERTDRRRSLCSSPSSSNG